MVPRKMIFTSLTNYRLSVTLAEPDWRKQFEAYVNLDMLRVFITEEEILTNKNKSITKRKVSPISNQTKAAEPSTASGNATVTIAQPKHQQFFHFVRGLYFELGVGLTRPDIYKAREAYCQGFHENKCGLCAYKIAIFITARARRLLTPRIELERGIFFLVMSAVIVEMQYSGMTNEIRSEMIRIMDMFQEGIRICEIVLNKYSDTYFITTDLKQLYVNLFEFQYCHTTQAQDKYQQLLVVLEQRIKGAGDYFSLSYLLQLLCLRSTVQDKNLKSIIDIIGSARKECLIAWFQNVQRELRLIQQSGKDNQYFFNLRSMFYEMYSYFRFFYERVWQHTQQQQIYQQTNQLVAPSQNKNEIWQLVFQINNSLYEKKAVLLSQSLHYSMTIRIQCEFYEKAQGTIPDLIQALNIIQEELNMSKENDYLYAYANYQAAKIKRKLPQFSPQQIDQQFQKSMTQFQERLTQATSPNSPPGSNVTSIVYLYYLGRIAQIWANNYGESSSRYQEALQLYILERQKYKNVKTLQFEIVCIKVERKTQQVGRASLYFGINQPTMMPSTIMRSNNQPLASSVISPYEQPVIYNPQAGNTMNLSRSVSPQPNTNNNISSIYQNNIQSVYQNPNSQILNNSTVPVISSNTNNAQNSMIASQKPAQQQNVSAIPNDSVVVQQLTGRATAAPVYAQNNLVNSQAIQPDQHQIQSPKPVGIGMKQSQSQFVTQQSQHLSRQLTPPIIDSSAYAGIQHPNEMPPRVTFYNGQQQQPVSPNRTQYTQQMSNLSQHSTTPRGQNGQHGNFRVLANGTANQFSIERRMFEKLNMLKTNRTFIDPSNLIILDFLYRGQTFSTSEAVIKQPQQTKHYNGYQENIITGNVFVSQDKLSKLRSFKKHMLSNAEDRAILEGEPVVVKQFNFTDVRGINELFDFLAKQENRLSRISLDQAKHLVPVRGFSYQPISNEAVAVYLLYPSQAFNLYGAMKRNPPLTLQEKLQISAQICDAIWQLHSCSIYPLNIKPSNILFDQWKMPYISGWEIQRASQTLTAEENLNDDESDDRLQANLGYSAPEIFNAKNTNHTLTKAISNIIFGHSTVGNASSDVWSTGMILQYLLFGIDGCDMNFCREKRIYGGFNLVISDYVTGSNFYLDQAKVLVESMSQFKQEQRPTMQNVAKSFWRLYSELTTHLRSLPLGSIQYQQLQQGVFNRNTAIQPTQQLMQTQASTLNRTQVSPYRSATATPVGINTVPYLATQPNAYGNYSQVSVSPYRNDRLAYTTHDAYTSPLRGRTAIMNSTLQNHYPIGPIDQSQMMYDQSLTQRSLNTMYDPYTNPNLINQPNLASTSQIYPRSPATYVATRSISPQYI